jgi:hypothetical protein
LGSGELSLAFCARAKPAQNPTERKMIIFERVFIIFVSIFK